MYELDQVEKARQDLCLATLAFCRENESLQLQQAMPIIAEGLSQEDDGEVYRAAGSILIERAAQLEDFDTPELPPPLTIRQRFSRRTHTRSSLQQEHKPGWAELIVLAGRLRVFGEWTRPVSEEEIASLETEADTVAELVN